MPIKMNCPCRFFGCPNLVRGGGYCQDHKEEEQKIAYQYGKKRRAEDTAKDSRFKFYQSVKWKKIRKQILFDYPFCQAEGCNQLALEVDHIVAIQDGGSMTSRKNLQALCTSCHAKKTAREVANRAKMKAS